MKTLFLVFIILSSSYSFTQNPGLFGKKNIVDFNFIFSRPLLENVMYNSSNMVYVKRSGTSLEQTSDKLDVAFNFSYIRSLSKRFNLGVEFLYQKLDTKTPLEFNRETQLDYLTYSGLMENLNFRHIGFIPKIEFCKENSIFGIGLHNQIGFGYCKSSIIEKDYLFELTKYDGNSSSQLTEEEKTDFKTNFFDYKSKGYSNFIFLYVLNFRKNLTKNLMLNYGFRYTFNFLFRSKDQIDSKKYWINNDQIFQMINAEKKYSIVQFKIGLSYVF
ncbi:MAG: hypothetical protein V4622_09060 [Bacteroidota bacterium]